MDRFFPSRDAAPHREIFPGVHIRTCSLDKLMLSYVDLAPGAVVAEHHHPHEQMGYMIQGRAVFIIDGVERTLGPGDWYRIPGNVRHKVIALDEPVKVLDVFSPPREEYR